MSPATTRRRPATIRRMVASTLVMLLGGTTAAQVSGSYRLEEHAINAAGHPQQGTILTSSSFRVSLDALGDAVLGPTLGSDSFRVDGGFAVAYGPPLEVEGLVFVDHDLLQWDANPSAVTYNLYRDPLSALPGTYGACLAADLPSNSTSDDAVPVPGEAWFYLVTAENRLREEGPKGTDSAGNPRSASPACP